MKKIETKSLVLLKHHLKALKLLVLHSECEKVAARCASDNVDHLGFLLQLCEPGLLDRELLVPLVEDGEVVGRQEAEEARTRHREALAELPPYALQLSRGYPAIPTVFESADGDE